MSIRQTEKKKLLNALTLNASDLPSKPACLQGKLCLSKTGFEFKVNYVLLSKYPYRYFCYRTIRDFFKKILIPKQSEINQNGHSCSRMRVWELIYNGFFHADLPWFPVWKHILGHSFCQSLYGQGSRWLPLLRQQIRLQLPSFSLEEEETHCLYCHFWSHLRQKWQPCDGWLRLFNLVP